MPTESDKQFTASAPVNISEEEKLEQVRSVLLAPQAELIANLKQQILALEARVSDPETRSADTSEILAKAVKASNEKDDRLSNAMKPIVVEKFREVSRDDPELMAEALFPILGPAVRKMIVNIISPDKKKKRGYRVEQLFLIEKNTGLPVCHVASDNAETQDADMVSGMLSAIQSFVHDAFQTQEFDGLNTLELGELSVWIEWGPHAILAAVVRGAPPKKLRDALQIKIEQIHRDYGTSLENYNGDSESFEPLKPDLILFLDSHDGSLKNRIANLSRKGKRNLFLSIFVLLALVVWMIVSWVQEARWNDFVTDLQNEPGIIVTDQEERDGVYHLYGLRDPYATEPRSILENSDSTREVKFHLEPYNAIQAEFIQERAEQLLKPTAEVELVVMDTTVYISGRAPPDWIARAKPLHHAIVGATSVIFNVRPMEDVQ